MPQETTITTILHQAPPKKDFLKCAEADLVDAAIRLAWTVRSKKCVEYGPSRYFSQVIKEGGLRTHVVVNSYKHGEICRFKVTPDKLELVENSDDSTQGGVVNLPEIHRQAKQGTTKLRSGRI